MVPHDMFSNKEKMDDQLAEVDAAFERLLTDWHQASSDLTRAAAAHIDEFRLFQLQRKNSEARRKLLEILQTLKRMEIEDRQQSPDAIAAEEGSDVSHTARAY
ncbi:MAG: hypothetical protein AAFQ09_02925 [Pseudomonadota bacterium]